MALFVIVILKQLLYVKRVKKNLEQLPTPDF